MTQPLHADCADDEGVDLLDLIKRRVAVLEKTGQNPEAIEKYRRQIDEIEAIYARPINAD